MTGSGRHPRWRSPGAVALLCSLVHLGFSLQAREIFLHDTGPAGFGATTLTLDAAAGLVLLVGVLLAFRGLTRADTAGRLLCWVAIALACPALGDALTWLLQLVGARPGRGLFLSMSGVPMLLACIVARRAAGVGSPARARPPREEGAARPHAPAGLRTWLGRITLAVASVLVGLLLCELTFRVFGPRRLELPRLLVPGSETASLSRIALMRPYSDTNAASSLSTRFPPYMFMKGWYDQPEWDYFDSEGCVDYVFNRHGLRDHDFEIQKQEGELRIVAIGDSFTFGVGVQLEHVWTEVLERELERVHDGPVEVINAGFVSGHTPVGYEEWLTGDGLRLRPDVVIVGLCLNDLHPYIDLYAYRRVKPGTVLGGRSELLTHLRRRWLAAQPRPRAFLGLIREDPSLMEETMAALGRTRDALEASGVRFIVAVFPMLSGLRDEVYPYGRVMDLVIGSCEEMGIEVIDLRPGILGRDDRTLWVHPTDQHPNDVGQRLLGEGIFRYLQQN